MEPKLLKAPPRADLAFRVGIIGHRWNRLPTDSETLNTLRQVLRLILTEVKAEVEEYERSQTAKGWYSEKDPVLRAVCPLAEGTDRIFAKEAIDLGYELLCPMPFHRQEFEKDFEPPKTGENNSVNNFRDMLELARTKTRLTTFELDGERSTEARAYGAAGSVVLNQSDILIAVWDGEPAAGGGGSVQTLKEAVQYHVPVLWIDAKAPQAWQLVQTSKDFQCLEGETRCEPSRPKSTNPGKPPLSLAQVVRKVVHDEISLPPQTPDPDRGPITQSSAEGYFCERQPKWDLMFYWKLFRNIVGDSKLKFPNISLPSFVDDIRKDWPVKGEPGLKRIPTDVEDWVNHRLRVHYAWPDKRGDNYADKYRSAYVLAYLLSALAIFFTLLPLAAGFGELTQTVCVAIELAILLAIIGLISAGRVWHWHERWMEYRFLAELIRQLRFLIPLGGGRPYPRVPDYLTSWGDPTQSWMYWHMRAVARATSLPQKVVTPAYVLECLDYVDHVVGTENSGQFGFHEINKRRCEHIAHRLHRWAFWLFVITFICVAIHLLLGLWDHSSFRVALDRWLVLFSAVFPALGAALAGINNQGEFVRLHKRSTAMAARFRQYSDRIEELRKSPEGPGPWLYEIMPLARNIAAVMVNEVADWRVVFIDRPNRAG